MRVTICFSSSSFNCFIASPIVNPGIAPTSQCRLVDPQIPHRYLTPISSNKGLVHSHNCSSEGAYSRSNGAPTIQCLAGHNNCASQITAALPPESSASPPSTLHTLPWSPQSPPASSTPP